MNGVAELIFWLAFVSANLLFHVTDCQVVEYRIINTPRGLIRGRVLETRPNGPKFYAFQGIRYGTAARFELARPWYWQSILNATQDGPACPQGTSNYEISEDCLHLSVYVRQDVFERNVDVPVLVYIHGGGFNSGSSSFEWDVGPQYLLEHPDSVVFVAINYRLNIFGFISTGQPQAPGNLGLKDQVLALRWIKENIAGFRGLPGNVTLMGESAGSRCVSLHMVSPMSRGLFQRVILMSGSAIAQWKPLPSLNSNPFRTGLILNCSSNPETIFNCLKNQDLSALIRAAGSLSVWEGFPTLTWLPVIEEDFGQERFLTEDPANLLPFVTYDVLAGITRDEWVFAPIQFLNNPRLFKDLDENFEKYAPLCFLYDQDDERAPHISKRLREETFGDKAISPETVSQLNDLFSEGIITFGVYRTLQLLSQGQSRMFLYRFSYLNRYCHAYYPEGVCYGVAHADDLYYFLVQKYIPQFLPSDPEWPFIRKFTFQLVQFAKYGSPNAEGLQRWPEFRVNGEYMELSDEFTLRRDLPSARMSLWDELFPINESSQGDESNMWLWVSIGIISAVILVLFLIFWSRRTAKKA